MPQNVPAWDDGEWSSLATLDGDVDADVCVIGLGGSGLTCIRELQSAGMRVVGVDGGSVGSGAAGRNGGFLLAGTADFYHDSVAALGRDRAHRIYELTLDQIDRIAAETPDAVHRDGSVRIATSNEERRDCDAQLAAMISDGLTAEVYTGPEGTGLFFPRDGAFQPLARCRSLALVALAEGALLFELSPAVAFTRGLVETGAGRIHCTHIIACVDGRLEQLFPELAGRVRTARLQMLGTEPLGHVRFTRPVYARWGYNYWQQLPDGRVVLGGGRDSFVETEWTMSAVPTAEVQSELDRILRDEAGVTAKVTHRWAASVGYTTTGAPVLEQVRPGIWAIGAYSGTGNVIGALYGRAVAQLVVNGHSDLWAQINAGAAGA
ncbi:MAG: FAD-binding oxidoreductase [Gemmatimonadaceae bacterium]